MGVEPISRSSATMAFAKKKNIPGLMPAHKHKQKYYRETTDSECGWSSFLP